MEPGGSIPHSQRLYYNPYSDMMNYYIRFTLQELVQLTWVFSRSFSMSCASFSMARRSRSSIENYAHGWHRKASAKNSSKLNKFLQSEVNILIQNITVQDQDGQNNTLF